MDNKRIHDIINESITDLLISEGFFGNNNTFTYLQQISNNLNNVLSSLNKNISVNQIVFKPNVNNLYYDGENGGYAFVSEKNNNEYGNANKQAQNNDNGNYRVNGNTIYWENENFARKKSTKINEANTQQQPQYQQQLTPQQQQIQSKVPEVVRCWNWGKQVISDTISLIKQYLEVNGIKESRAFGKMIAEDGANGTMVNPWQILRGGVQSGINGYWKGYRQGQNLINKFNGMRDKYNQQKRDLQNKEKLIQQIKSNVQEYFNFCNTVENCRLQISLVSVSIVFGREIEQDIERMTSPRVQQYYQNILNIITPKKTTK